jgi:Ca2+-binding RTX toxin-like protein
VRIAGTALNDALDFSAITLTGITLIDGGAGNDTITGSAGADVILGNLGTDTIQAGAGDDVIQFGASTLDVVDGGSGNNSLVANVANALIVWTNVTNVQRVDGGAFTGVRIAGTAANDVLDLSAITLTSIALIDGGAGNDTITGSAGADVIFGNLGTDTIQAGAGDDTIQFGAATLDVVDGGAGSNRLVANAANASIVWPSVTNVQRVEGGAFAGVALLGSAGADLIDLSAVTLVNVARIDAAAGNDTIRGSTSADTLFGGTGADQLTGGAGADIFGVRLVTESRTAGGIDVISDFTLGSDRLDLSAIDASTTVTGNQAFSFIGTSAFSGVAGQLRIDTATAGRTKVLGDINGDRLTDVEVHLLWSDPNTPLVITSTEIVL